MRDLNSIDNPKELFYYYINKHLYIILLLIAGSFVFLGSVETRSDHFIIGISSIIIAYSESFTNVLTTWHFYKERAPFVANTAIIKSIDLIDRFFHFYTQNPKFLFNNGSGILLGLQV